jgi:hypothetical protein
MAPLHALAGQWYLTTPVANRFNNEVDVGLKNHWTQFSVHSFWKFWLQPQPQLLYSRSTCIRRPRSSVQCTAASSLKAGWRRALAGSYGKLRLFHLFEPRILQVSYFLLQLGLGVFPLRVRVLGTPARGLFAGVDLFCGGNQKQRGAHMNSVEAIHDKTHAMYGRSSSIHRRRYLTHISTKHLYFFRCHYRWIISTLIKTICI